MSRSVWWLVLGLSACGPTPPSLPTPPDTTPLPPPEMQPPVPPEAPKAGPACSLGFSANEANEAFGVASELSAGTCAFEAARTRANKMQLVWKDAKGAEHVATVHPAKCSDLPAIGDFALDRGDTLGTACPGVLEALEKALADGAFPAPSTTGQPEAEGPDGSGTPGPSHPENLPPRVPPNHEQTQQPPADLE